MRPQQGRIRFLVLATMLAIAWPSSWACWPRAEAARPVASPSARADGGGRSLRAIDPRSARHDPSLLSCADQEEADEGDDASPTAQEAGLTIPGDLPSLIPAPLAAPEPAPSARRSPLGATSRLRC